MLDTQNRTSPTVLEGLPMLLIPESASSHTESVRGEVSEETAGAGAGVSGEQRASSATGEAA